MTQRYLPLYRKYRPQTFKDLIGQENIVKALSNAINLNKISHAYLLCGPRGTGKTTTARIIAKSLNCAKGPTLEPCGECPSCKDITNSTPIDVIEIDAASNRKVEDARNILEKIQFVPVNGRFKIYIIDEVHMLTTEAFNTLLKTLEEPPENVIFILATTEPHKVLDTIISRCQRFDFRRITTEDIVARLQYICEQENINITQDALYTIARSSAGGMRDSLALLDQISVLDADKEISSDDVNEMLGRLSFETLFDLSNSILDSQTQNAIELLDKVYNKGNEPFQIITNLIQFFRNMLVVKNCTDRKIAAELTQLSEAHILKLREQSENIEPEQMLYTIERLSYYSKEIKETTNRYLWLELCIIELSSNVKYSSYAQLLERIERLEANVVSGEIKPSSVVQAPPVFKPAAAPVQAPQSTQPPMPAAQQHVEPEALKPRETESSKPVVSEPKPEPIAAEVQAPKETAASSNNAALADIATAWQGILQNIESIPSRMFFYNLSRPVELSKDGVTIAFLKEIFVKQAQDVSKNAPLKKAAMSYFNVDDINIHIKLADASDPEPQSIKPALEKLEKKQVPAAPKVNEAEEEAENAMLLKETLSPPAAKGSAYSTMTQNENTNSNDEIAENLSDQSKMVMELFNGKYIE
ncbi:MAG: DNA polymerase III subunit gamma/tau [Clostridium sp.]|nr:DNA polymerase III subunit gamma/tau [Clostridium sp.]